MITLSSEQNGIIKKLREIISEISAKEKTLSQVKEYLISEDAFDFIRDNVKEISLGDMSLDEICKKEGYSKLSVEQLEPFIKEYKSIFSEVIKLIRQSESIPSDFYMFIKELTTDISKPEKLDWYELAYDFIYESLPKKIQVILFCQI